MLFPAPTNAINNRKLGKIISFWFSISYLLLYICMYVLVQSTYNKKYRMVFVIVRNRKTKVSAIYAPFILNTKPQLISTSLNIKYSHIFFRRRANTTHILNEEVDSNAFVRFLYTCSENFAAFVRNKIFQAHI